ncbi:peptidylprolyl isomerase [Bordetella genomosp. 11]|uniref:peptidylprolyl isomerase n=1 Tax=Bordetella genomosp. 11 TaxID=1416808 RepID=A0A261USA8_9BORD|nr:peptidylprolyl isomerase [Bordetella genomosp. 11]
MPEPAARATTQAPQEAAPTPPAGPVRVNGHLIEAGAIAEESASHGEARDPIAAAARALAIRELLRQRAAALGLIGGDGLLGDEALDAMLDRELTLPRSTPDDCRRYYDAHPARFRRNDIVYASHILLAVTDRAPLALLRRKAEETLAQAVAAPAAFGDLARERSNCPSAAVGGSLGQLLRGDSVPEFERALFDTRETGILPRLVNTRFGFHIVRIERRVDGEPIPFDTVQPDIARFLEARARHQATRQYIQILASQARVEGIALGGANGPLVQ